jgi:5'-phosphate synthase pdxT subunit
VVRVGVLALQGDVAEHEAVLRAVGAQPVRVRDPGTLERVDALVIPGGESTTMAALMERCGLDVAIRRRAREGLPIFGTCAGMIVMARHVPGRAPPLLALMDIAAERNAYGRQADSFEDEIQASEVDANPFRVAFIRAPVVTHVGEGVQVLAHHGELPVLVRQGRMLAASFHPEITGYPGVHRYFCDLAGSAPG